MSAVLLHALIPDPAALASLGPWLGLAALGVFHGLNPAMGWLFAVSLALQRQQAAQLYTATGYIAVGHLASVVIIMAALVVAGAFLPLKWVRIAAGAILLGFGFYRLARYYRHPRWVGMNVGGRDLIAWSFLMATAHGAGLMLAPVALALTRPDAASGVAGDFGCPGRARRLSVAHRRPGMVGRRAADAHCGHADGDAGGGGSGLPPGGAGVSAARVDQPGPVVGGIAGGGGRDHAGMGGGGIGCGRPAVQPTGAA